MLPLLQGCIFQRYFYWVFLLKRQPWNNFVTKFKEYIFSKSNIKTVLNN